MHQKGGRVVQVGVRRTFGTGESCCLRLTFSPRAINTGRLAATNGVEFLSGGVRLAFLANHFGESLFDVEKGMAAIFSSPWQEARC